MSELVFISFFNYGAIDLAKNHLKSLKNNNISNYIAYVTDDESFNELSKNNYNVIKYIGEKLDTINKEKNEFGSSEFNKICYIRYNAINNLLKQGKVVWLLDIDTVVLGNLNNFYKTIPLKYDICFQNDINMLCCGCMLFRPNYKTIKLTQIMYSQKNNVNNDQILMNKIIKNTNLSIGVFKTDEFPNGLLYFNELNEEPFFRIEQEKFKKSNKKALFVHANYMIGNDEKIKALMSKNLWFI